MLACHTRAMNHTAKETESGAIREIEPEIRTLFTKVVTTFTDVGCLLVFLGLAALLI